MQNSEFRMQNYSSFGRRNVTKGQSLVVGTSNAWWHGSVGRAHRSHQWGKAAEDRRWRKSRRRLSHPKGSDLRCAESRPLRMRTVGSSPTVTTTNPVGVQVQRLPDFFAYPSRVRRSPENCLLFQIGYANNTMLLISRAGGEE